MGTTKCCLQEPFLFRIGSQPEISGSDCPGLGTDGSEKGYEGLNQGAEGAREWDGQKTSTSGMVINPKSHSGRLRLLLAEIG